MTKTASFTFGDASGVLEGIASPPPRQGTYDHARWIRDLLLMSWVLHHPERIADLFRVTWKPDNSAHLHRDDCGKWKYRNTLCMVVGDRGSYELGRGVAVFVEPYLETARARLVKPGSDSLLNMPSNHIQTRVATLLARHFGRAVSFSELRRIGQERA